MRTIIRHNFTHPNEIEMKKFRKKRNQAMNNIFDKYNLPRNVVNNQIKRRVKYHDWARSQMPMYTNAPNEYEEFLMDRTVFNEKKRKDMVKLAIDYSNANILSLRSPVIIAYLWEIRYLHGDISKSVWTISYDFIRRFIHKELKVFGKFREDKAFETVLKKRIAFLRKLKRAGVRTVYVPMNVRQDYPNLLSYGNHSVHIVNIANFMKDVFPIPPHTNSTKRRAATTIQKTTRGVLNRKKVTTLKKQATNRRKAATTIQKTVRGMLNRKKVKARTARAERMEKLKSKTRKRKR
jgi:hypothetical protein